MIAELAEVDLDSDDEMVEFCSYWLNKVRVMTEYLGDAHRFDEEKVLWLIRAELEWNRREYVVKRLISRFYRMKQARETQIVRRYLHGQKGINSLFEIADGETG